MIRTLYERKPLVKERARSRNGGRTYTPARTREFEKFIADNWKGGTIEGPARLDVVLFKDMFTVELRPSTIERVPSLRGDVDNYIKAISDGLNGVAYQDDKMIVEVRGRFGNG